MTDIVIHAQNLGKKYVIGHQAQNGRYVALHDVVMHNASRLWNTAKDVVRGKPIIHGDSLEEVWPLKDVSFEIRRGEAVGIVRRNMRLFVITAEVWYHYLWGTTGLIKI